MFGFRDYLASAMFGLFLIGGYFVVGYAVFISGYDRGRRTIRGRRFPAAATRFCEKWGPVRFGITGFLLIAMAGVVIKMALRHALNIKYILVTPWINI